MDVVKRSDQIFYHHFGKETLDDIQPILRKEPEELSELEQYLVSVFRRTVRLADSLRRLEQVRAYLAHFRILKQYKESGINRADYIKYHYSNHAVILLGIFDLALILTNNVFKLGIPERQCRSEIIIQNSWIHSRGIDKILQELNSAVEPLRQPRNIFIHRGYPRDSEPLSDLTGLEIFLKADNSSIIIPPSRVKPVYERVFKKERSRIIRELGEQEDLVTKPLMKLLDKLHPVYKFWKRILYGREKNEG